VIGGQNADIADTLSWQPLLAFYIWGAHWRQLANTTQPPMCVGDAALCQVTLTTCWVFVPWGILCVFLFFLNFCSLYQVLRLSSRKNLYYY